MEKTLSELTDECVAAFTRKETLRKEYERAIWEYEQALLAESKAMELRA